MSQPFHTTHFWLPLVNQPEHVKPNKSSSTDRYGSPHGLGIRIQKKNTLITYLDAQSKLR